MLHDHSAGAGSCSFVRALASRDGVAARWASLTAQSPLASKLSLSEFFGLGGVKPQLRIAQFILRYRWSAPLFCRVPVAGCFVTRCPVGLSTLLLPYFFEALREIYFVMIQREEIIDVLVAGSRRTRPLSTPKRPKSNNANHSAAC